MTADAFMGALVAGLALLLAAVFVKIVRVNKDTRK